MRSTNSILTVILVLFGHWCEFPSEVKKQNYCSPNGLSQPLLHISYKFLKSTRIQAPNPGLRTRCCDASLKSIFPWYRDAIQLYGEHLRHNRSANYSSDRLVCKQGLVYIYMLRPWGRIIFEASIIILLFVNKLPRQWHNMQSLFLWSTKFIEYQARPNEFVGPEVNLRANPNIRGASHTTITALMLLMIGCHMQTPDKTLIDSNYCPSVHLWIPTSIWSGVWVKCGAVELPTKLPQQK